MRVKYIAISIVLLGVGLITDLPQLGIPTTLFVGISLLIAIVFLYRYYHADN